MTTYKIATDIRREIATAIVRQSDPGYDVEYFGQAYAVDTNNDLVLDAVYFKESQAPWNPWHDNAVAFPVADLYAESAYSFDPTPDFSFKPEEMNDEEYALAVLKDVIDFAESELPISFEPLDEDEES